MRFLILFFFLSITNIVFSQDLKLLENFGRNKGGLKAYTYIPKNLNTNKSIPLVVVLHGCNQTAKSVANATGWNKFADSLNFIILYPEQRQINNINKCFNFFIAFKAKKDKGEVASIKSMIDFLIKKYNIDKTKIFITGMSAGGGMTNALLNAYPELFNAGVLIESHATLVDNLNTWSEHIPKIAIIQGLKDKIVKPANAKKLVWQWARKNKIDTTKYSVEKNYLKNPKITSKNFYNKNNNIKITVLYLTDVGHQLCINPGDDLKHGGRNSLFTKNIGFYSTYWIANFFGLIKNNYEF